MHISETTQPTERTYRVELTRSDLERLALLSYRNENGAYDRQFNGRVRFWEDVHAAGLVTDARIVELSGENHRLQNFPPLYTSTNSTNA